MKKMLLFLCLSSLLTACSKKNDETISSCTFDYGLPNAHFIVYANKADWLAEKNPLLDSFSVSIKC
jgi:major membrane immunogen (membrane-anchored lipoprotein)